MEKATLRGRVILRSKNLQSDPCKQTFELVYPDIEAPIVIITRRMLLNDEWKEAEINGDKLVKKYKNKWLYEHVFAIKLNSIYQGLTGVMELVKEIG